jgi:hypothetical protein
VDAQPVEGTNEVTVFGGASLLDVSTERFDDVLPLLGGAVDGRGRPAIFPPPLPELHVRRSIGSSAEFGVRFGRYLSSRLAVEGDFAVAPGHDLTGRFEYRCPRDVFCIAGALPALFVPDRLTTDRVVAWHYGGGFAFDLLGGDVRPAVIGGLGAVTYDLTGRTDTDLTVRLGAAIKGYFGRLGARLEVVDHVVPSHFLTGSTEHDVHARAGIIVRW